MTIDPPLSAPTGRAEMERGGAGYLMVEQSGGIIRVTGQGYWSLAQVQQHFSELATTIATVRSKHGKVLALIDLTASAVQSPEVAERINRETGALYSAIDRVAIVVESPLLKMQMRRSAQVLNSSIFLSRAEAEAWLTA
jgi:ribosome-associated translation inhibitor RaiA